MIAKGLPSLTLIPHMVYCEGNWVVIQLPAKLNSQISQSVLYWPHTFCCCDCHITNACMCGVLCIVYLQGGPIEMNDRASLLSNDRHPQNTRSRDHKGERQTLYKKPGPPTPSKNGGRHSLQVSNRLSSQFLQFYLRLAICCTRCLFRIATYATRFIFRGRSLSSIYCTFLININ